MKTFFSAILISAFSLGLQAADPNYWSTISAHHTHLGCHYWTVQVWCDGGTPSDPNDDFIAASNVISDCDEHSMNDNGSEITSVYEDQYSDCLIFKISVKDNEGNHITYGAIGSQDCF